jgi:hypothetical protein
VVVLVPEPNEPDRIEANSGITAASLSDGDYEKGALIPTQTWQHLTRNDRQILVDVNGLREDGEAVQLITPPSAILDRFRDLRELARRCPLDEVRAQLSRPAFCEAVKACTEYVRRTFALGTSGHPESITGGIRVNRANLRTVAVSPQTEKFVGLHIDNWTRLPLTQRNLASRRICINLGNYPRYLLFINLSIRHLLDEAMSTPVEKFRTPGWAAPARQDELRAFDQSAAGTAVARAFLVCSPKYPVIRLKVYPGEAYIASTENIIHDGSSLGTNGHDVSVSLRAG